MDLSLPFGTNFGPDMWGFGIPVWVPPFFMFLALWSLFWKGLALWHAARRGQGRWFVAMLVINTIGILEIIYIFGVAKRTTANLFSKN